MILQFKWTYDGENGLYKIRYTGNEKLQLVVVGESSMKELSKSKRLTVKEENDLGSAIGEYFMSKNIISTEENPVFILHESNINHVKNSIPLSQELLTLCENYLDV